MKRKNFLPFCQASLDKSEMKEVEECLKSGWLTMGTKVQTFEQDFAKYTGAKYAISVNSCTAALELALLAHGIGPGDEVLVPSFTFVASVNVILHVGAKPVFVDIEKSTLTIDLTDLKKKITKKSKAVIAVHYAGMPTDITQLKKISKEHHLTIIEDAAHAVGTTYKNKQIGNHGNTTCFSFYATKTITTGEGGMLTTNDSAIAEYVMRGRLHGISKDAWKRYLKGGTWKYDVLWPGMKCNMTDIQAALGIHQLKKLETFIARRTEIVKMYQEGFANNDCIKTIQTPEHVRNSYHLFPILIKDKNRDTLIEQLAEENIGTSVHFIPVHQFSYYKDNFPTKSNDLQVTNEVGEQILSLPLYPSMKNSDVKYVIRMVNTLTKK